MSATRNLGIGVARGEFIAFIDADDVWRPHKLAEQVALLDDLPEVGLTCGTVCYWSSWSGGEDALIPTGHVQNRVISPPEALLAVYPLGTAGGASTDMLVRRRTVDAVGGFETEFTGMYEDQAFLVKVYLTWPVWFSDAVWLDYRQHPASEAASVIRSGGYHASRQRFLSWFEEHLDSRAEPPPRAVRVLLARAWRPYRRPLAHTLATAPRRLASRARRELRALVLSGSRLRRG
jgi:glycosyltransferase involved in cell wall biosynthesis